MCQTHGKKLLGLLCILVIVSSWMIMAVVLHNVQQQNPNRRKYDKPFFLTYFVHAGYSLAIPIWWVWNFFVAPEPEPKQQITMRFINLALGFSLLLTVVAYTWYKSLSLTMVSSNTAIYNCSPSVVFILSIFALNERVTIYKAIALISCISGVLIVAFLGSHPDTGDTPNTPIGLALVTASAILYAVYEVIYALVVKEELSVAKNVLLLGLIGVMTTVVTWPIFIILHMTGVETFELPLGEDMWSATITLGLDLVLNIAVCCGLYLTSPVFISLGSLLTIPVSIVVDLLQSGYILPWPALIGVGLICVGFLIMNLADEITCMKESPGWSWENVAEAKVLPNVINEYRPINDDQAESDDTTTD